jgi:hypothetical protein
MFDIDKKTWENIKKNHSREDIIQAMNCCVKIDNLQFQTRNITVEKSKKDYKRLKEFDTTTLIQFGKFDMKFDYKYPKSNVYISKTSIGKDASNYFMQLARHKVSSHNKSSIYDAWYDEKCRLQTFNALFTMKRTHVNNSTIMQTAECKHYLPSAFRPTAVKTIYDFFGANKILDMSSGWGDRLVASCGREYVGFDPNTNIFDNYKKIINTHNLNATVELLPFEDSSLPDSYFDIMFSSPPYFSCEKYSEDDTQSCNRYKTTDDWLNLFMFKSIDKIIKALKYGGIIALNISDVNIRGKRIYLCDKINDYISSLNLTYIGCYGLQLSKLPNTNAGDGIFCEPVWIWKK